MRTRPTCVLAARCDHELRVTFVLLLASAAMGQDFGEGNALLWILGEVVWFGFLLCALVLVVLTVGVLVRSLGRSRHGAR